MGFCPRKLESIRGLPERIGQYRYRSTDTYVKKISAMLKVDKPLTMVLAILVLVAIIMLLQLAFS